MNMLRFFIVSLLSIMACYAFAQDKQQIDEKSFVFELQAPAKILYQESLLVDDYILALGKYKKRDNRWRPQKLMRLQGQLQRMTIELPRDYTEEEVFAYYKEQLPDQALSLFECEQRSCGESNAWANNHFGVKQLYGLNQAQYYGVYLLQPPIDKTDKQESSVSEVAPATPVAPVAPVTAVTSVATDNNETTEINPLAKPSKTYVTIYTVRRGNRRLYTQLEVLDVN